MYSVVDRDSFDNASKWFVEAYRNMGALPPTVIVANKIDLRTGADAANVVTTEEGEAFTKYFIDKLEVPAVFIETSAKTGENVQDTFTHLLKMMSLAEKDDEFGIFQGDPGI